MSQAKPAVPDPVEIAGRYHVVQRLGAGAFGTVYKARDTRLNRMVAIKTIRLEGLAASVASLDELLKRFKVEATTAAQLKHPNIVTIYDFGNEEGLSYLALEFIDGIGLDRMLSEGGKLPVGRAAALMAQVADALHFAHRHNVIHRDIKPANIMVEAGDQVKVTDFGIAKATDSGEHLTMTGSLLGTPSYMSPEQARATPDLDGRSDLFSAGCVLYELLTGRKAFRGDSITAVLFKIVAEEPTPIQEIEPTIPEEMVRVLARVLSKAPETRYQTGRDLADDLRALAYPGSVPTVRQPDSPTGAVDFPTLSVDPTARGTLSSTPTVASAPTGVSAPTAAVPPTRIVDQRAGSPPPPPLPPAARPATPPAPPLPSTPSARAPRAVPPAVARRRSGGGAARLVGLAAAAAALLLLVGLGGWWLLGRRAPVTATDVQPSEPSSDTATPPSTSPSSVSGSGPVEAPPPTVASGATPPPAAPTAAGRSSSEPVATREPRIAPPPRGAPTAPAAAGPPAAASPPQTTPPPAAGSDAFLDELPEDRVDGSAAGRELASQYSQGQSSGGFTKRRFNRRAKIPKHTAAEQPAVATLAWILSAQNAHQRRTGRYGSLQELLAARDLPMSESHPSGGFERRGYRFTVTTTGSGFRADAHPLAPGGRAFYTDDSGFVLVADD